MWFNKIFEENGNASSDDNTEEIPGGSDDGNDDGEL